MDGGAGTLLEGVELGAYRIRWCVLINFPSWLIFQLIASYSSQRFFSLKVDFAGE